MMLKSLALRALLTSLILLTACGDTASPTNDSKNMTNTTQNSIPDTSKSPEVEASTNFNPSLDIDFKKAEGSLSEDELPLLDVLEKNLNALVQHDHNLYRSGFVTEKLADAMEFYYSEEFMYKFSAIESIEKGVSIKNQVHITILGERLNTTTETVEDVKMMYAIRMNDRGEWSIYTID